MYPRDAKVVWGVLDMGETLVCCDVSAALLFEEKMGPKTNIRD
jgi:hypothetical protein